MKTQASTIPDAIELQRYHGKLQVYLRRSIEQIDVTDEETKDKSKAYVFEQVSFMADDISKLTTAKADIRDEKSLVAFIEKNFDEIFDFLSKSEYEQTLATIDKYLERKWLKQSDVDSYVAAGIIKSSDVKK